MSRPVRRRRHAVAHEEEHANAERWLLTYADMITLLMVLFIVLFAISQVDQRKFDMLKAGLAVGFNSSTSILDGTSSPISGGNVGPPALDLASSVAAKPAPMDARPSLTGSAAGPASSADAQLAAAKVDVASLQQVQNQIQHALAAVGMSNAALYHIDQQGLVVSIVADQVLFPANVAVITPRGQQALDAIAKVLAHIPNKVSVEGNTNQVPVKPLYYATDWGLSAARAVSVTQYLVDELGLPGARFEAVAFASHNPLIPPADPRSVWMNRRVDLVIHSSMPPDVRQLLPLAATLAGEAALP
ncbi:MAG: OmpA/MotB family protein [Actinomycetes bacterium]